METTKFVCKICFVGLFGLLWSCKPASTITTKNDPNSNTLGKAQDDKPIWVSKADQYDYQPSRQRVHDLIHTKLEVSFDWEKQYLNGLATLTLKPYFYNQQFVELDAKGFVIHSVNLIQGESSKKLSYTYLKDPESVKNSKLPQYPLKLRIDLGREYTRDEEFVVQIKYTAKPNELLEGGSDAITSDKGLYFINPLGKEKDKPRQIWTQGETEASSCWFPTIDAPNEKTTQEIYITVDTSLVTLSNGKLISSKYNTDNTRVDYWRMDKPHAPYLFMMAIGEFAKVEDKWRDIDVDYYVEKEYEPYAKLVFGNTPEMMEFFSNKLGYAYPWAKYSQIAVRDYVSGAMENTSASIFLEQIQLNDREVLDKNWDYIIAHELFHHWFGDLTTCESWSNLALNESFANYSEYLWMEYKYGRDDADFHAEKELLEYLDEATYKQEPIIRYHYDYRDDMFDRHSYNKGGRVLHMLRKYVGDEAFFASLKLFLERYEYQPVEIHHLRLVFEEVTGEDLNWFFNQWFLAPGHPKLKIRSDYSLGKVTVKVEQFQNLKYTPLYKIPLRIDYWVSGIKKSKSFVIEDTVETFEIEVASKPELVLFDGEQVILGELYEEKAKVEYVAQYQKSDLYLARKTALLGLTEVEYDTIHTTDGVKLKPKSDLSKFNPALNDEAVRSILISALDDEFYMLRVLALDTLKGYEGPDQETILMKARNLAQNDSASIVRSKAMELLGASSSKKNFTSIFESGLDDSSYTVVSSSLVAYLDVDGPKADEKIKELRDIDNLNITKSVAGYYIGKKITGKYDWFYSKFSQGDPIEKLRFGEFFAQYLLVDSVKQKEGIELLRDIATNHDNLYARFGGYKGLWILNSVSGVAAIRKEIREGEKNKRLLSAYDRLEKRLN